MLINRVRVLRKVGSIVARLSRVYSPNQSACVCALFLNFLPLSVADCEKEQDLPEMQGVWCRL